MVIKINRRFQAGAYRWLGGKHYWILDTKTGIRYKGLNASNFETLSRVIKNSHDLDRVASKIKNYTYTGRYENIIRMEQSYANLLVFQYGNYSGLTKRFKKAFREMALKDPELWQQFVEKNNEWFTEYWQFYDAGAYQPYSSDINGKMSAEKRKKNAQIRKEARDTLTSIIEAMEQTTATGKVKVVTHELKDYRNFSPNDNQ